MCSFVRFQCRKIVNFNYEKLGDFSVGKLIIICERGIGKHEWIMSKI